MGENISNDQFKFAAKNILANFIFILLNCILVFLSDTKVLCLEIIFLKCNKVKRIVISFHCFSEYMYTKKDHF